MVIEVLPEDRDNGTRRSRQSCMMANAFRRAYGKRFVGCGMKTVSLYDENMRWVHERRLPDEAIQAVYDFEGGVTEIRLPLVFEFYESRSSASNTRSIERSANRESIAKGAG